MGSLPSKAVTGANFKKWTVETLNKLIDYLHGARIKPGYGIMVRETPSGTIVELAKRQASQPVSVSGGTSSVTINGMVWPDWSKATHSGVPTDGTSFPIQDGDAWIYINGYWTSTGSGDSQLYIAFNVSGGGSRLYQIGGFSSIASGQKQYFQCLLPACKNSSFFIKEYTSSAHSITFQNAYIINYPQST